MTAPATPWPRHLPFAHPTAAGCGFCDEPALDGRYVCARCAARVAATAERLRADGPSPPTRKPGPR